MDRETGESSIKTVILNASDRVKRNINILRNEGFKNKSIIAIDDEHPPKNQGLVKPLRSVNNEVWAKAKENVGHRLEYEELKQVLATDFDAENQKLFDYFAATRDLEVDTPRTKKLEQIIENMNYDGAVVSRVIILRKGQEAFLVVTPDGTMLVSQFIVNLCDSEDELAAIFGHEMGHLKNKSHLATFATSKKYHDGIRWIHEAVGADQESINYMEKGNYKVSAFATIIEKVSGIGRDESHQSGQMRAAQSYASFAVINRTSSAATERPLSPELKRPTKLTNLEIIGSLQKYGLENLSKKDSIKIAKSLHPSDLGVVFKSREVRGSNKNESKPNLRAAVENEVVKRVQDLGYTETHGDIFVQLQKADAHIYDSSTPIDSPRKFQNVCETLGDFNHTALVNEIHNSIFFSDDTTFMRMQRDVMFGEIRYSSVEKYFYNHSAFEVYDKDKEPNGKGIPVTQETFINGMAALRKGRTEWEEGKIFANLVSEYLMSGVVGQDLANGKNVDVNKLGVFFTEFFNKGAGVNGEMLLRAVKDRYTHNKSFSFNRREYTMTEEQKESYINAIIEVFGIVEEEQKPEKEITFDDIDRFLKTLESPQLNKYDSFEDRSFFLDLSSFLNNKKMTDSQRKLFVDHVIKKLPDFKYRISKSAAKYFSDPQGFIDDLHEGSTDEMSVQEKERSEKLYKFYVATLFISHIYEADSEEFYASVGELCIASGIDFESLSKIELLNLCQELLLGNMNNIDPIILTSKYPITLEYSSSRHRINDYAKFSETIFMRAMLSKREVEANNLAELNQKLTEYKEAISFLNRGNFGDDPLTTRDKYDILG